MGGEVGGGESYQDSAEGDVCVMVCARMCVWRGNCLSV